MQTSYRDKKYPQNPRGEKQQSNLSWLNWNAWADSRRHDKIPVEKVNFKFRQYYEAKREVGPNKTA